MTMIRVWLSHDGYRDPDDNLAMLIGGAKARVEAQSSADVRVGGVLFGDTKDGGQYYTLNPDGTAPAAFGTDNRYGDVAGNERAAGNYAFFLEYGKAAMKSLGPGWKLYDLLATDQGGLRAWNFDATARSAISPAARALATDIADAVTRTGGAETPAKVVVYSAGGGANVAGEAIGYLLNQGYSEAELVKCFVVVQHGNNWVTNYEPEARELTRDFTIAISNQNYAQYANGMDGPGLNRAVDGAVTGDTRFPGAYDTAIAVATGGQAFQGLPEGARFRTTLDASDSGSHAYAVDRDTLLAAMSDRLSGNEEMRTGYNWAHLIDTGPGTRLREIVSDFDPDDVSALLWGGGGGAAARVSAAASMEPAESGSGAAGGDAEDRTVLAIAAGGNDRESAGGRHSDDLDLGTVSTAAGTRENTVTLHFGDAGIDPDAGIESAYLLFEATRDGADGSSLTISAGGGSVDWDPGAWTAGGSYRSADVSALVEAALAAGGDGIDFAITGTGSLSAQAFEADDAGPRLVIDWDIA